MFVWQHQNSGVTNQIAVLGTWNALETRWWRNELASNLWKSWSAAYMQTHHANTADEHECSISQLTCRICDNGGIVKLLSQDHANTADEHECSISQLTCRICDNGGIVKLLSQDHYLSFGLAISCSQQQMHSVVKWWQFCRGQLRVTHWHSRQLLLFLNSRHTLCMNTWRHVNIAIGTNVTFCIIGVITAQHEMCTNLSRPSSFPKEGEEPMGEASSIHVCTTRNCMRDEWC